MNINDVFFLIINIKCYRIL